MVLVAAAAFGCRPATDGQRGAAGADGGGTAPPWLEDQAAARGIDFVHDPGPADRYFMPEIMGGGAALVDLDGDGDLDLYCVQGGDLIGPPEARPANRLFVNRGDGFFQDATTGSGADDRGYGMGVACGDYDGDGDVDLYVTNYGPDVLLANDGQGRFRDVTAEAGVGADGWSTGAAFFDADGDGDLDLWVCSYLVWTPEMRLECFNTMGGEDYCSPRNFMAPAQDRLFENLGDGTFAEATAQAGLIGTRGTGLGIVCKDFTGDGRADVFVANDGMADHFWVNEGKGRFVEAGLRYGCAYDHDGRAAAGMGVAAEDLDGDGDQDLMVCNLRNESDSFFRNEAGRVFSNVTAAKGLAALSRRYTRFGLGLVDFDNDGCLDLYQANGRVMRQAINYGPDPYAEPNLLFQGRPDGSFEPLEPPGGTAEALIGSSRAAAFGDVDGDGGIDAVIIERGAPARLLMNVMSRRGHWVGVCALDEHGAPALGARVEVVVAGRRVTRVVHASSSYLASNDPCVHVGIGKATAVDEVVVIWGDGVREVVADVAVDNVTEVRRSSP